MHWLRWILIVAAVIAVLAIAAGQVGLLEGSPPEGLGMHDGRLAAPSSTPNSVSSQAGLFPGHPQASYARIDPLRFVGNGTAAMARLGAQLRKKRRTRIVEERPGYIRVEFQTPLLHFIDDAEFMLDDAAGVIHLRSASRLGRKDFGVNRQRIEGIRARFATQ